MVAAAAASLRAVGPAARVLRPFSCPRQKDTVQQELPSWPSTSLAPGELGGEEGKKSSLLALGGKHFKKCKGFNVTKTVD